MIAWLCRDCLAGEARAATAPSRCPACGKPRVLAHGELYDLAIAHLDCDAFYAAVEKRDRPELRDRPVVVGGGQRGVVSAACYVARLYGIHSAMPMFKALRACPEAVVIKPNMKKYQDVGRQVRAMMENITPLVEPLSIDEAFLDLTGTQALHRGPPAKTLAALVLSIEKELQIPASIGLSHNKFLAKIASDLDKPRGFAVIGAAETESFLGEKPVGVIWGVGKAFQSRLRQDGINLIRDLRQFDKLELMARYGAIGGRLYHLSRGEDTRSVQPHAKTKSISAETTFDQDLAKLEELKARLWPLCETVSRRLKAAGLAGQSVTLKLKTADFRIVTRSRRQSDPTRLAEEIYRAAAEMLAGEANGVWFRLIGVGASDLKNMDLADPPDLLDPGKQRRRAVEEAMDAVRGKLGSDAIMKGRSLKARRKKPSP
ncbi:MAG TPA: DNA polymerase IV [Kiloniellaceae bacterium]|nr:DNA polymerase IV [Kiloniellaceae bacterium]